MAEFAKRLLLAIFAAFLEIGIAKMIDSQYLAGGFLIGAAIIILLVYSIWVKVNRPCSKKRHKHAIKE